MFHIAGGALHKAHGAAAFVTLAMGSIIVIWKPILAKFEESVKNIFFNTLVVFFLYLNIFFLYLKFSEIANLSFFSIL